MQSVNPAKYCNCGLKGAEPAVQTATRASRLKRLLDSSKPPLRSPFSQECVSS